MLRHFVLLEASVLLQGLQTDAHSHTHARVQEKVSSNLQRVCSLLRKHFINMTLNNKTKK